MNYVLEGALEMNIVFLGLSIVSITMMLLSQPDKVFGTMIDGAMDSITLGLKMLAIYSVWLSVLRMMEETGVDKLISKIVSPLTGLLFKGESQKAKDAIAINFSANLLGMGGVATPAGMRAMSLMQKEDSDKATPHMILLLVIAATSIQLIPATVIALRSAAGSTAPTDILAPTLIATSISTILGIFLCKTLEFLKKCFSKMSKTKSNNKVSTKKSFKLQNFHFKNRIEKKKFANKIQGETSQ